MDLSSDLLLQLMIAFGVFCGVLVARVIFYKTIFKVLERFTLKESSYFDHLFLERLKKPINFIFIIVGLSAAINFVDLNPNILGVLELVFRSALIFIFFWAVFSVIDPIMIFLFGLSTKNDNSFSQTLIRLFGKIVKLLIFAIACVMVLQEWGYNVTGFMASLGIVGMAFALAAKDTTANLFGSMVVFSDKPFVIGDWININNQEGFVEDISIRSTKIRRFDQAMITQPNSVLTNSAIINYSRMGKREIKMQLNIAYDTPVATLRLLIDDIRLMLMRNQTIDQDIIHVYLNDLTDNNMKIFCYFYTTSIEWGAYLSTKEEVIFSILKIAENLNVKFALPTRIVQIENQ